MAEGCYNGWRTAAILARVGVSELSWNITPVDDRLRSAGWPSSAWSSWAFQYSGLQSESVGPYSAQNLDYAKEREAILKQLSTGAPI